jgi:hypothetical protein
MGHSDRLELALDEIERMRTAQDAELGAAFSAFADLGGTSVRVEAEQLRQLSECANCSPCLARSTGNRLVIVLGRC